MRFLSCCVQSHYLTSSTRTSFELSESHVHRGIIQGIQGTKDSGAYSIVLNGGYDDDKDLGDTMCVLFKIYHDRSDLLVFSLICYLFSFYTGAGGREKARGGKQIQDQSFETSSNKCLQVSF